MQGHAWIYADRSSQEVCVAYVQCTLRQAHASTCVGQDRTPPVRGPKHGEAHGYSLLTIQNLKEKVIFFQNVTCQKTCVRAKNKVTPSRTVWTAILNYCFPMRVSICSSTYSFTRCVRLFQCLGFAGASDMYVLNLTFWMTWQSRARTFAQPHAPMTRGHTGALHTHMDTRARTHAHTRRTRCCHPASQMQPRLP